MPRDTQSQHVERVERHWLVLEWKGHHAIRIDARAIDRVMADGLRLILAINEYAVGIHLLTGAETARILAEQLSSYTRGAPIRDAISYDFVKRRLEQARLGSSDSSVEAVVYLADTEIVARGNTLYAGTSKYTLEEAAASAEDGAMLQASNGGWVPGTIAMIAFAHHFRVEDTRLLSEKIAEYERQHR